MFSEQIAKIAGLLARGSASLYAKGYQQSGSRFLDNRARCFCAMGAMMVAYQQEQHTVSFADASTAVCAMVNTIPGEKFVVVTPDKKEHSTLFMALVHLNDQQWTTQDIVSWLGRIAEYDGENVSPQYFTRKEKRQYR